MSESNTPQFLDLQSYRHKRLMDAARVFPLLGIVVLLFPLPFLFNWSGAEQSALPLALYLFVVWLVLIVVATLLSRRLRDPVTES